MLLSSLFTLIIAAALPNISIASIQITRCATLIFLSSSTLAANVITISNISYGINIYDGLLQVSPLILTIESFIYFVSSIIVGFVWIPVKFSKT